MCNDYEQAVFLFQILTWNFQKLEACFIPLKVGVLLFGVCVCVFSQRHFLFEQVIQVIPFSVDVVESHLAIREE